MKTIRVESTQGKKIESTKILAKKIQGNLKAKAEAEAEAKERLEKDRLEWIKAHGSERLRKAVGLGYRGQYEYILERAKIELPEYKVDFSGNADWSDCDCPTLKALEEIEKLTNLGFNAEVVWLTQAVNGFFTACESIVIHDYLGSRYSLVKEIRN